MFKSFQPKLTGAKCRRNVDNFLSACRKIGVREVCTNSYIECTKAMIIIFAWVASQIFLVFFPNIFCVHCPPVRSSTLNYFLFILTVFNLSFNQSVQLVTADGCPGRCPTSCNNMARSLDLVHLHTFLHPLTSSNAPLRRMAQETRQETREMSELKCVYPNGSNI